MADYMQKKTFSEQCQSSNSKQKLFIKRGVKVKLIKEENFQGDIFSNDFLFKVVNRIMTVLTIRKYNTFQRFSSLIIRSLEIA